MQWGDVPIGNEAVEEWKSGRVKAGKMINDRERLRPEGLSPGRGWTFLSLNSRKRRESSHKNRVLGNNTSVRGHRSNNRFQDIETGRAPVPQKQFGPGSGLLVERSRGLLQRCRG
jgi:hypothetical protein